MASVLTLLSALALTVPADESSAARTTADPQVVADSADVPPPSVSPERAEPPPLDNEIIEGRRRPDNRDSLPEPVDQNNPGAVRAPPPEAFPVDQIPLPDRWRLIETLGVVKERWFDPYHQNTLKGDRPLKPEKWPLITGDDWFFTANLISDTVIEPRTFPIPVGVQTTSRPGSLDVFGKSGSYILSQTVIAGASLVKGSTAFKPPEIEYRVALAFNVNYAQVPERRILFVEPSKPTHRSDHFLGLQEAFVDYHIRNTSDRYDFDSVRVGIQPFQSDFRGFLFNDQQLGVRLFGNRDDNRVQYNLAAFWRLEKDTNSGLNSVVQAPRKDWLFVGNVYRQDFLIPALTSQVTVAYNRNREGGEFSNDKNGFPSRPALLGNLKPRNYDVVYAGYNADGHIGRVNLTASLYGAFGEDRYSFFTGKSAAIQAFFAAAEVSYDHDWMRFRLSGAWGSGDHDPYDNRETGFDAVFENPVFAGADTSYWIRQAIPFAGGGRQVFLNGRNGLLNSLRSSKEEGQSNFNNPGVVLVGAGGDFDVTPEFRLSANANHLWFENTNTLQALRSEGSIPTSIGWDLSTAAIWRPRANQNIVGRLSVAALVPGAGFRDLFTDTNRSGAYFSVLANVILTY